MENLKSYASYFVAYLINNLQNGLVPLAEPGLTELLNKHRASGHLNFSTDFSSIHDCESVFLTFDTPVGEDDEPDLSLLFQSV